eukprot:TRINITY_DN4740_c0_g1_i1.p1 TRINITY_DN4740_c0_g1~~TRINITY_DN4740_c0_g1_i1.p1  ORF type:complete len:166 (-),score=30.55 TRINITY_DN4740_c0_g1_i1:307-762(-)
MKRNSDNMDPETHQTESKSPRPNPSVQREVVHTDKAPAAIGPYSQAIKANGLVFCSGSIALAPGKNELVSDTIEGQTKQVMENLKNVLEAAGSSFEKVVKTTILLIDMAHFPKVNEIYGSYFPSNPPARATFAVAGLPRNALVEIECVALA